MASRQPPRAPNELPQDLLLLFLNRAGRTPLLTPDEEVALAQEIEAARHAQALIDGGAEGHHLDDAITRGGYATDRFILANLRLVVRMAADHSRHSQVHLEDLIQDGTIGLMRAVEKFDWRRGYRFSTYATWWIRRELQRGVVNAERTIRLPHAVHAAQAKVGAAVARLERESGRMPTPAEIAAATNLSTAMVSRATAAPSRVFSLDARAGDGGPHLVDGLADGEADVAEQVVNRDADGRLLADVRRLLDDRSWLVVSRRFGLLEQPPRSMDDIAAEIGMSRETARLILKAALERLREHLPDELARSA